MKSTELFIEFGLGFIEALKLPKEETFHSCSKLFTNNTEHATISNSIFQNEAPHIVHRLYFNMTIYRNEKTIWLTLAAPIVKGKKGNYKIIHPVNAEIAADYRDEKDLKITFIKSIKKLMAERKKLLEK